MSEIGWSTFADWLSYNHYDWPGESNWIPSQTVPDQTMSVREILRRFAAGVPPEVDFGPGDWQDEEEVEDPQYDLPDFNTMDGAERAMYAANMAAELEEVYERINKARELDLEKRSVKEQKNYSAAQAQEKANIETLAKDEQTDTPQ